ncbi:hypothetical protein SAMN05660461_4981 [Chitinophaga ginsengisegetis]|uniref:Uncharacterized protein n=1 Tax=Chitinophaga ginsengisegetis TaxID=393003 RepID=A0A1T5P8V3_9BACT|nr:hypothetical protein [Chitinophaga ginsengisegetis]MDR6647294.1 hypothetical protein [Chitinophaga ginsengisegetis]MDR6653643.1 hypothetical protein [Chitinophaga ginsengisegetis]SKD09102.1 hypothetical protein SAMN05660461_4981 [Chitinophaga ginsengisegetis]
MTFLFKCSQEQIYQFVNLENVTHITVDASSHSIQFFLSPAGPSQPYIFWSYTAPEPFNYDVNRLASLDVMLPR